MEKNIFRNHTQVVMEQFSIASSPVVAINISDKFKQTFNSHFVLLKTTKIRNMYVRLKSSGLKKVFSLRLLHVCIKRD